MKKYHTNPDILKDRLLLYSGIIVVALILSVMAYAAETECPLGLVNDTAPGNCGLYADSNTNELCDLSEPHNCTDDQAQTDNPNYLDLIDGTTLKTKTVSEIAALYEIDAVSFAEKLSEIVGIRVNPDTSFLLLHDSYGLKPTVVKEIASDMKADVPIDILQAESTLGTGIHYNLIWITIMTTLLYFSTFALSKFNILTVADHRKIWNWLLLASFVATSVLALIWLLNIEYRLGINIGLNTSYWHIETGLVMIIISLFHVWWHLKYYFSVRKRSH